MNQCLGAAILKKDKFVIEDFLKAGADPNALIPGEEFAPIHLGAGTSKSVTQLLLKYGADPNARTREGSTPLHIAASWGRGDVLKLLLKYGADMSIRDNEELNALGLAGKYEFENCVHILQNHERKHEIDIQGKKHRLSNAYNQIEINVYLNRIKLFSACINGSSKMFQLPDQNYQFADQNYQFAEDGPITAKAYKTEEDEYDCELKQSDGNILTLSRSPSLISSPLREDFLATSPHEQVQRNKNNEEDHLSDDQCSNVKIRQGSRVHENPSSKIEYTLINNNKQNRFHNDPKSWSDQRWKEALENPPTETFFHPSLSSQHTLEIHDSYSNFHARQHMISQSDFNDVLDYATQDERQNLKTETVYIDQGSHQTLTLPHTEYHFDHDEWDRIDHEFSDCEINKKSLEQQNEHSKYQRHENRNASSFETKMVKSETQNAPNVPCSCNNHLGIKTNPLCKPERRRCRKCWNKEFCAEIDNNLHSSRPCETVSDFIYPDNVSQKSKYKCVCVAKQEEDSKDEIYVRSYDSCTETYEAATKQSPFRKYSNNLYLKCAASVNKRKGFLPTEKLASMKKAFHRISNCRICLATKAMFTRLKRKISQ